MFAIGWRSLDDLEIRRCQIHQLILSHSAREYASLHLPLPDTSAIGFKRHTARLAIRRWGGFISGCFWLTRTVAHVICPRIEIAVAGRESHM
jgi:hypothetical protein